LNIYDRPGLREKAGYSPGAAADIGYPLVFGGQVASAVAGEYGGGNVLPAQAGFGQEFGTQGFCRRPVVRP
jgi:hypothetical protein